MPTDTRKREHGAKSDAVRSRVLTALLEGPSIKAAATAADVDESTIRTWVRSDEDFSHQYHEARGRLIDETLGELVAAGSDAVRTLRACLSAESESFLVSAGRGLLEYVWRSADDRDLEDRIEALCEQVRRLRVKL